MKARIISHYLGISVVALWLGGVIVIMGLVLAGIIQQAWFAESSH